MSVFKVPFSENILSTLATHLLSRFSREEMANVTVLLPTRRAKRTLTGLIAELACNGKSIILPRMISITDFSLESFWPIFIQDFQIPIDKIPENLFKKKMSAIERVGTVSSFISKARKLVGEDISPAQSIRLSKSLMRLVDEAYLEEKPLKLLESVAPEDFAAHWQQTIDFFDVFHKAWDAFLETTDAEETNRLLVRSTKFLTACLDLYPLKKPLYAVGIVPSFDFLSDLLRAIFLKENGVVLFEGGDFETSSSNAYHYLKKWCERALVEKIPYINGLSKNPRDQFLEDIFIGRKATGSPTNTEDALLLKSASEGFEVAACSNVIEEAETVALSVRKNLEKEGAKIVIVSPDPSLSRLITYFLKKWGISPDSSAGERFILSSEGQFLLTTAETFKEDATLSSLFSVLQHPYTQPGEPHMNFLQFVRGLQKRMRLKGGGRKLSSIKNVFKEEERKEGFEDTIEGILQSMDAFKKGPWPKTLSACLNAHKSLIVKLDPSAVFLQKEEVYGFIEELEKIGHTLSLSSEEEYRLLLASFIEDHTLRRSWGYHPRVTLYGVLESRLQKGDHIILSGMNEGSWPRENIDDPWLSESMKASFGLKTYKERLSLETYDFMSLAAAPSVLITYSTLRNGSPCLASKFVEKIQTALKTEKVTLRAGEELKHIRSILKNRYEPLNMKPPAPRPSKKLRPLRYSLTDLKILQEDPYQIFVKYILNLKPLGSLKSVPGSTTYGTVLHQLFYEMLGTRKGALKNKEVFMKAALKRGEMLLKEAFEGAKSMRLWVPVLKEALEVFYDMHQQSGALRSYVEVSGNLNFLLESGTFINIRAKADRIDLKAEGAVIIDYKTGALPSLSRVKKGQEPQLPLEGLIYKEQGFKGISGEKPLLALSYWHLPQGAGGAKVLTLESPQETIDFVSQNTRGLLSSFHDGEAPYKARPFGGGSYTTRYDQLSRFEEWGQGKKTEEGAE